LCLICLVIQLYVPGWHGAALQYPGKHHSTLLINSSLSLNNRIATNQNFNSTPDVIDVTKSTVTDTITLRSDGTEVADDYTARPADLPRMLYSEVISPKEHTIKDFLGRYAIIVQGSWSSSQNQGVSLATLVFPKDLLNNVYDITQNTKKVDGFVGMKARVRVRMEVNSQAFQAGCLLLNYIPYSEYMQSHTQWINGSTTNPIAATGCPHVILNLANTTSMEFCTPYIAPYLYANLVTGQGSFGTVTVSVLSPLASSAASTIYWTIWARFEDIELVYPTPAPLVAGTGWAQAGEELQQMETSGVIASSSMPSNTVSATVGQVGRAIATSLPLWGLGFLSVPVAIFSNTCEAVLKWCGFSKPTVQAPVMRVLQSPARFFLNSDGSDTSHKLGLSAANELQTFSGFAGTDSDEMRLDHIASHPCYFTQFTYTTTQEPDQSIFLRPVSPMWTADFAVPASNAYAAKVELPLCAKVATFFSLWRGDMVYTFRFVKTQFHSGRVRVSFLPYSYADSATVMNMPAYAYTEEIDLSSASDFTFVVPYTSVRPWLQTIYDPQTAIASGDARNCASGSIQVSVINPLVAASTVSSTVSVLVFVSMRNAQFACPVFPTILPYDIPNVAQIGAAEIGGERTKPSSQATVSSPNMTVLPYSTCTGEVSLSFRQLLKRFQRVATITTGAIASTDVKLGTSGNGFVIYPWAPVIPQVGPFNVNTAGAMTPTYDNSYTAGGTVKAIVNYPDLYSALYAMYGFFRGSMRYKILVEKPGTFYAASSPIYVYINNYIAPASGNSSPPMQPSTAVATTNLGTGPIQPIFDIPATTVGTLKTSFAYQPTLAQSRLVVYPDKEGVVEFEVPFHATGHMVPTNYGVNNPTNARSIFYPFPIVTIQGSTTAAGKGTLVGTTFEVFRAVGDDFSFGALLGSPPHAHWTSTVNPK